MDEKEYSNVFAIPANYTDSGKLFGGMLETRNTIEAALIILLIGYPELMWLHVDMTVKVVIMTVTLLPLGVLSLMGISGDSLFQYAVHITMFWMRRRILHFRRIGYRYEKGTTKTKGKRRKSNEGGFWRKAKAEKEA